ncbi:MAG: type IA DNA topoisomerase, partial [Clostridia bacterium]|nr:type IA DNA topoisomerase [Clostridia bacterium]
MKLIIAEKPSLARNIIAGIDGKMDKRDGFYIGDEYIVTWTFGHLFSLADVEAYSPSEDGRWTLANLPCFPKEFRFELKRGDDKKVDRGVEKQFKTIKTLCNRTDVVP